MRVFSLTKDEAAYRPEGVAVREPVEGLGNTAGCYGLLIAIALVAALLATLGLVAPENDDLNVAITAER